MTPAKREAAVAVLNGLFPGQTFFVFVQPPNPGQPECDTHYLTNAPVGAARKKRLPETLRTLANHFERGDGN